MIKKWLLLLPLMATAIFFAISSNVQASSYNLTITNSAWYSTDGSPASGFDSHHRTDKAPIINNKIVVSQPIFAVMFWNNNNVIGSYADDFTQFGWGDLGTFTSIYNNGDLIIPNNATHFSFIGHAGASTHPTTFSDLTNMTITYSNPIPYTIEQKNPYYDEALTVFEIRDYRTVFVQGTDYSQNPTHWNYSIWWYDDNGYLVGSTAGDNDDYANNTGYMNLVGEHIYLNMPVPANITETGTYDLWFTLFDYNGDFKATYRPTNNNISVATLRDLGGYSFRLNYTENYAQLPDAQNFSIEIWRSETNGLLTFYDTDSTTLIQLAIGTTNEYQPGNNALWVDSNNATFDIRDYLTANSIALPTKEGHTLLGFSYDFEYNLYNRGNTVVNPEPAFVFGTAVSDIVFWPVFEQNITYDVTFTDYDDSIIEVVTVEPGQTAIPTQTPTRQGYIFAYWEPPVTDIQGNLTTKAIYYVPITWRNSDFSTIRIDQVIEGQVPTPPTLEGYTRTWTPDIVNATEPTAYVMTSQTVNESSGVTPTTSGTTIFRTQLPDDYSGITDLFGGVFGAIVGTIMILGTIDLFGVELSSLFWLFFAGSGFFMIWRFVR